MTQLLRTLSRAWILVPLLACAFVLRNAAVRAERIERVSRIGLEPLAIDHDSPTGYATGKRDLLIPERNAESYQWIIQTQDMLARGEWRVRHAAYDNAPTGRVVHSASLYRWWIALLAKIRRLTSDEPMGIAVSRAALFAGPWLHVLAILVTAWSAARKFGRAAAAVLSLGLTLLYPLGGTFAPGQPDDFGLSCIIALWSVLLLLPSPRRASEAPRPGGDLQGDSIQDGLLAGIVGGIGLWLNVRIQAPVLLGIIIGAVAAALIHRREASDTATAPTVRWRRWGGAGAAASAATYLLEYFPSHLDVGALRLEVNHPLYAVAWLGAAELLARLDTWTRGGAFRPARKSGFALLAAASLAVVSIPVALLLHETRGFFSTDTGDLKLSALPESPVAETVWAWIMRDGLTAAVVATYLPLFCVLAAFGIAAFRRGADRRELRPVWLAIAPVAVMAVTASWRLRTWSVVDVLLLGLVAAGLGAWPARASGVGARRLVLAILILALMPGAWLLRVPGRVAKAEAVTESEAQALVERDLAYWLAARQGAKPHVILAPPAFASSLTYYGGHRALVSPYWENFNGFAGTARIAGADSLAEAESLARRREIDYVVLPSWETDLETFARFGGKPFETTLIGRLQRWLPPLWLRPVAYKMPVIEGFSDRTVAVFGMTEVQEDPVALSRLAEYFAEMGQHEFAVRVAETLRQKYPRDVSGLIARAQVAAAVTDGREFGVVLGELLPALTRGEDADLLWERRVSLAVTLAQGKRADLARQQLEICVNEADPALVRTLSTGAVIRLATLMRRFELEWPDDDVRGAAEGLLPAELRAVGP